MATRGKKPLPDAVKKARGETRPSKLAPANVAEFPAAKVAPEPPEWLEGDDALSLWEELADLLFVQKVLANVDVHALGHLCQLHGRIVDGYRRRVPPTAAEMSQLRMYFSEFGLTPSSRTRVQRTGGGADEGNRFGKNGRRGRSRAD